MYGVGGHEHAQFEGSGRTNRADTYPNTLLRVIFKGYHWSINTQTCLGMQYISLCQRSYSSWRATFKLDRAGEINSDIQFLIVLVKCPSLRTPNNVCMAKLRWSHLALHSWPHAQKLIIKRAERTHTPQHRKSNSEPSMPTLGGESSPPQISRAHAKGA